MVMKNNGEGLAVIYARYSSDNQRSESIDAQVRAAKEFAAEKGLQIIKVYTDKAYSALTDNRPQFQQMIKDSASKMFDVVIVHKLDRFSRNKYHSVKYKNLLKKNGIQLLSTTEQLDDSPESIMFENMLEDVAQYYSQNLGREVMKGLNENALKCMHTGGRPPLGYDVDPLTKHYIINEKEALAVQEIFELYLSGCGYHEITVILNRKGYKTKIGNAFGENSLHDILANEKYCGTYTFNRAASRTVDYTRNNHESKDEGDIIRIPNGMPAIISKEDFAKVKAKMHANKTFAGRYKAKENYLFSGLIYCGKCGEAMHGNTRRSGRNKTKYSTYRCSQSGRDKACDNKEVQREYIESFVLKQLKKLVFSDDAIPTLLTKLNAHQNEQATKNMREYSMIKTQLIDVRKELDNIVSAVAKGFAQTAFKDKLNKLESEKARLEDRLSAIEKENSRQNITEDTLKQLISGFQQFVKERNISECKRFISTFVEKVTVYETYIEVAFSVASFSTFAFSVQRIT